MPISERVEFHFPGPFGTLAFTMPRLPARATFPGAGLLWVLALIGLVLSPSDYRAGAVHAHAHALWQLLLDAADGQIHHHDEDAGAETRMVADWFDPTAGTGELRAPPSSHTGPDIGTPNDTSLASSSIAIIIATLAVVFPEIAPAVLQGGGDRPPAGVVPRVPSPPPR